MVRLNLSFFLLSALTCAKTLDDTGQLQTPQQIKEYIFKALSANSTENLEIPPGIKSNKTNERRPCKCGGGKCECCTGTVLNFLAIDVKNHLCSTMKYNPTDVSLGVKIAFNERVLFENKVSARNPPPICLPIPRFTNLRFCLRFYGVRFVGRNIQLCPVIETQWNKNSASEYRFDCIRMGKEGIVLLKPEDYDEVFEEDPLEHNSVTTTTPPTTVKPLLEDIEVTQVNYIDVYIEEEDEDVGEEIEDS